jgi:hypothetical protein
MIRNKITEHRALELLSAMMRNQIRRFFCFATITAHGELEALQSQGNHCPIDALIAATWKVDTLCESFRRWKDSVRDIKYGGLTRTDFEK